MTGCTDSSVGLIYRELDETIASLTTQVEAMLQPIAPDHAVSRESEEDGCRFAIPLHFPDRIGNGGVVARLFRYRDRIRLDVEIVHDRMLARPDGTPSDRRCYLNDFVASVALGAGTGELPADFRRSVLRGIKLARNAVQRHNREEAAPWNQIHPVALATN